MINCVDFNCKISTPSVPIYKHHLPLIKGCLYIETEGVSFTKIPLLIVVSGIVKLDEI